MTTYEAIPYPLALAGLFFGYTEWSLRLPACIFATLTIAVIGLMCRRLFDWRTGLFAALVYACLPLNIRWAQNAFYLSQCQFLSLSTMWLFYEAIQSRPLHRSFLTGSATVFCFCYLSWEGTGFLLPALLMGLLVVRWGEWWWLKDLHLYRCLFFMGAVVVAQYCSRMLAGDTYLQVGFGLSNLSGPVPLFPCSWLSADCSTLISFFFRKTMSFSLNADPRRLAILLEALGFSLRRSVTRDTVHTPYQFSGRAFTSILLLFPASSHYRGGGRDGDALRSCPRACPALGRFGCGPSRRAHYRDCSPDFALCPK